ncbi:MAG: hypothetical protein KKF50_02670 [Nanoarchaeota archaeon]|nr:hypothetical protein [Nanoarchaeota archaeon]
MENRKYKDKKRYLWALIIATVLFFLVIQASTFISYLEFERVASLQDPISYKIFENKLEYSLFDKDICVEDSFKEISEDLKYQGQLIGQLEKKFGINDPRVIFRKKFYTLVQIEHFEFTKVINEECNRSINSILFFYSNKKVDLDNSEGLGNILSVVYQKNDENLVLYSLDLNLDSNIIGNLKEKYNVGEEPLIIVNEDQRFTKIDNISEIERYLE